MFRLYREIVKMGMFDAGSRTNFFDLPDDAECFKIPEGVAFYSPSLPNYWIGNAVMLTNAPATDITGDALIRIWDFQLAKKAVKAVKKVVIWGDKNELNYCSILKGIEHNCEAILKLDIQSRPRLASNQDIKPIEFSEQNIVAMANCYAGNNKSTKIDFWLDKCRYWLELSTQNNQQNGAKFFAIWEGEKIVAIAGVAWHGDVYRYRSVATLKEYRSRGFASALISHILEFSLARHAKHIYIITEKNSDAERIYKKVGFENDSYFYFLLVDR